MVDLKLEVIVIPVDDIDRAKAFYTGLGWRLDADFDLPEFRVVQFTPPGSPTSIQFGRNVPPGAMLVVSDIDAAHAALTAAGATVGEVFHGSAARFVPGNRVPGRDPEGASYGSYLTFEDPDGNEWLLQEVTERLPGRVEAETAYASVDELKAALVRAAHAHGEHEARTGEAEPDWPDWYALYMVREQSGEALPE